MYFISQDMDGTSLIIIFIPPMLNRVYIEFSASLIPAAERNLNFRETKCSWWVELFPYQLTKPEVSTFYWRTVLSDLFLVFSTLSNNYRKFLLVVFTMIKKLDWHAHIRTKRKSRLQKLVCHLSSQYFSTSEDLLTIYKFRIRSTIEYCSREWVDSLPVGWKIDAQLA